MKRTLLLIGITLFTLASYGQKKTDFGIKGGLNYSSFVGNNDNEISTYYKGKVGFHIGAFFSFKVNEKLSIRPEILYSKQDSDLIINNLRILTYGVGGMFYINTVEGNIKESMLYIPIILEYKLNEKLNFGAGPQFGYSLNREFKFEKLSKEVLSLIDNSENFEIGIGLELEYLLTANYGISLRYNFGIIERQNSNTSVIQLGMNYKF
ncbi:PorT family protein [Polaribacter batillariae]|uniref:PorT family protein n=1 Tax=Polaribacter batillariae TaxID=2808900 RepID=A0ABX7SY81_9FLAO|nr:outer membrane beta-barrel protein [Polaribacter batillariae]QTD39215.1 PorT family protein [Polaribacter batillariae]